MKYIVFTFVFVALFLCSCRNNKAANEREQSEACFDSAEREQSRPKVKADVTFVHFYVDKTSGTTRIVEEVPSLNIEEETGTINLFDFLETKNIRNFAPSFK